jgi:hypothetical protein
MEAVAQAADTNGTSTVATMQLPSKRVKVLFRGHPIGVGLYFNENGILEMTATSGSEEKHFVNSLVSR